jgi:hypothetical protein
MEKMDKNWVKKGKAHIIVEIIEYVPDSVVIKSIIQKTTGSIRAVSFDAGKALAEKIIHGVSNLLNAGQSIIIPAHSSNTVKANERFKMISTIIKSGYE